MKEQQCWSLPILIGRELDPKRDRQEKGKESEGNRSGSRGNEAKAKRSDPDEEASEICEKVFEVNFSLCGFEGARLRNASEHEQSKCERLK